MNKRKWKLWQLDSFVIEFMSKIWEEYKDQLPEDTVDELVTFLGDPATLENTIETFLGCVGELSTNSIYYKKDDKIYENSSESLDRGDFYLTEEELFTLVIELCALHIYEWDFRMKEVLALLFSMRYSPENHKEDIAIWKELINAIE